MQTKRLNAYVNPRFVLFISRFWFKVAFLIKQYMKNIFFFFKHKSKPVLENPCVLDS